MTTPRTGHRSPGRASRVLRVGAAMLVLMPVVLALAVPVYHRTDPELIGIPFFYWFQMAMAIAAAAACGTVYVLLYRDEEDD